MTSSSAYHRAGVDITAGSRAVELMKTAVQSTYGREVLAGIGAFGGLYDAAGLQLLNSPVLVASTDGVGTKTKVASHLGRWDTIGQDLVNHCVNDILVQGAQPLFFLDYIAMSMLDVEQVATIVSGVAAACRETGCALLGGETAEMPGVYETGEIDLVGTIIGVVERDRIIDGKRIVPSDVIIGISSSGLHTNGFSLARKVLDGLDWTLPHPSLNGETIGNVLLSVHRPYLQHIRQLVAANIDIHGLAHITGGGVIDNLPRILPNDTGAIIHRDTWTVPPIFSLIQRTGHISDDEMFHVFNMGLGMLVVLPANQVDEALKILSDDAYLVGGILSDQTGVKLV
jgi:phosphoribosylformylglycinamidine cyclo-ligase